MNAIIIRYHFADPNPTRSTELTNFLRQAYGGALNYIAEGTIFLDTLDNVGTVYELLEPFFTFDDKLIIAAIDGYKSLHQISRTAPAIHRIAV